MGGGECGGVGIDAGRLAVGGDSAGGNLAAAAALAVRERGGPALCRQFLDLPGGRRGDDPPIDNPPRRGLHADRGDDALVLGPVSARARDRGDWRAAPLAAGSLAGVAPAYVLTAGYDPLSDEGEAYAERLDNAADPDAAAPLRRPDRRLLQNGKMIAEAFTALEEIAAAMREAWGLP